MRINHKSHWLSCRRSLLSLPSLSVAGESASTVTAIDQAQQQITAYLDKLADLHCTESVTQEKLSPNGHVEATERAKYDYLIMMSGSGDEFQLNESRIEAATGDNKQPQLPMLVTNGVATVLLVFHPYYRDGFTFEAGDEEIVNGTSSHSGSLYAYRRPPHAGGARIARPRVPARTRRARHGSTVNPAKW